MVIPNKDNLTVIDSSNNSSHGKGTYSISIVNTKTNGKRIKLSPALWQALDCPTNINILIDDKNAYFVPDENGIKICDGGIIYNTNSVLTITEKFKIDYSGVSSRSFSAKLETDDNTNEKFAYVNFIA